MSGCCTRCEGPIDPKQNKTGLCRVCWPKVGLKMLKEQDPEGFRRKRSEGLKRGYMMNPDRLQKARENLRRVASLPQATEARSRTAKELRIWEKGTAAQPAGCASRKRMGRRLSATKLAWCPPNMRDEYRRLTRSKKMRAAEAKEIILAQHEAEIARWRKEIGAPDDLTIPKFQPIIVPDGTGMNERSLHSLSLAKAEKARIEALKVKREVCPRCGANSDIGCEHSRRAA